MCDGKAEKKDYSEYMAIRSEISTRLSVVAEMSSSTALALIAIFAMWFTLITNYGQENRISDEAFLAYNVLLLLISLGYLSLMAYKSGDNLRQITLLACYCSYFYEAEKSNFHWEHFMRNRRFKGLSLLQPENKMIRRLYNTEFILLAVFSQVSFLINMFVFLKDNPITAFWKATGIIIVAVIFGVSIWFIHDQTSIRKNMTEFQEKCEEKMKKAFPYKEYQEDTGIPRIIHFCWFGGGTKPEVFKKCRKSWEKYCNNCEIREWDEKAVKEDFGDPPKYVKQAMESKKWAFVSDYYRMKILYKYGGIYFDTDVEVKQSIEPLLQEYWGFIGFDFDGKQVNSGPGFAVLPGNTIVKQIIDLYEDERMEFWEKNNKKTPFLLANTFIMTSIFTKHGLKQNNTKQEVKDITVLPKNYLCPKEFSFDKDKQKIVNDRDSYTVHHYELSWVGNDSKYYQDNEERWISKINYMTDSKLESNFPRKRQ